MCYLRDKCVQSAARLCNRIHPNLCITRQLSQVNFHLVLPQMKELPAPVAGLTCT